MVESVISFLLLLIILFFLGALIFKYHREWGRWLKDPKLGHTYYPPRETVLKRRIEDSEAEIAWLHDKEKKETETGED